MRVSSAALAVAAGLVLSACATVPTGPSVMVLPGTGKSFEQFQGDDGVCRQWALQQAGVGPSDSFNETTGRGAVLGTLIGAAAGAALGAAAGNPAIGAAAGAGAGLLGGTAIGAGYAEGAQYSVQQRYDAAYMQCMYARGNQIPVRGSRAGYSPPAARPAAAQLPPGVPPPPAGMPPPPPPPSSSPAAPPPPAGTPPPPPPTR